MMHDDRVKDDSQRKSTGFRQELRIVFGVLFWFFVPAALIYAIPMYLVGHFVVHVLIAPALLVTFWGLGRFLNMRFK